VREYLYDDLTDTLGIKTTYDPSDVIEANAKTRAMGRKYLGTGAATRMLKVASLPVEHIEALHNMGYSLLSPDPDEVRRALLYIQQNEPVWMTVDGKPIASFKQKWV
jgi:hypothetical protein